MRVLLTVFAVLAFFHAARAQDHYVPAVILIPTLNASTVQILHNSTANKTEPNDSAGWNNPQVNKTNPWNHTTPDGDLIVGKIGYVDRRLFNQIFWKTRRWWSSRQTIVRYPNDRPGSYGRHETISAIRVFSQFYDGPGNAEIISGGVGKRFAKIRLSSEFGRGFKYLVQIYGH
ncbi:uncharacterized protein BDFB_006153 [Asbolus verrucosus]|uniref:Salivary secreted peptide n=1 Tax=Asbolus verrucosus TaxID=1661398 RepID=A0A482VVI9_ASBVE|nr:uncharacterized protein BDFB_006153 [Asbolus verrucosus]